MRTVLLLISLILLSACVTTTKAFDRAGKASIKKQRKKKEPASATTTTNAAPSKKNKQKNNKKFSTKKAAAAAASSGDSGPATKTYVYDLEHATSSEGSEFTSRGHIEVTISKRSKSVRVDSSNIRSSLTAEESAKLRELAKTEQFYRLRLPSMPGSDRKVVASIPACTLLTGNVQESLWLHLDLSGHLVAFDYVTPMSTGECTSEARQKALKRHSSSITTATTVRIAKAKNGHRVPTKIQGVAPPPPGMEHLLKKSPEQEAAANQPGFLRRYWYIVLPLAVMFLLPGGK